MAAGASARWSGGWRKLERTGGRVWSVAAFPRAGPAPAKDCAVAVGFFVFLRPCMQWAGAPLRVGKQLVGRPSSRWPLLARYRRHPATRTSNLVDRSMNPSRFTTTPPPARRRARDVFTVHTEVESAKDIIHVGCHLSADPMGRAYVALP
ncbi:hypothetical protein GUJ93_ZPchr0458g22398 [Zizania palustris]|uniref:Uncharacterized protein n=1 Tax=Zizania palustris TaxID=103762 RepID=A0A8J5VFC2_ZIZPA|nr:hypothetical protein GUJ93_ZPchr0458g22398 [Zizania palustris]